MTTTNILLLFFGYITPIIINYFLIRFYTIKFDKTYPVLWDVLCLFIPLINIIQTISYICQILYEVRWDDFGWFFGIKDEDEDE